MYQDLSHWGSCAGTIRSGILHGRQNCPSRYSVTCGKTKGRCAAYLIVHIDEVVVVVVASVHCSCEECSLTNTLVWEYFALVIKVIFGALAYSHYGPLPQDLSHSVLC